MDPDEALSQVRAKLKELDGWTDSLDRNLIPSQLEDAITDLSITFAGLDEWLTKGGFPPRAWRTRVCRCGHPPHPGQCPAPDGCWCDSFSMED
jgi:hypothetical protein